MFTEIYKIADLVQSQSAFKKKEEKERKIKKIYNKCHALL